MQCVVVFAFVAVLVGSSYATTCDNISTCTPDVSKFQGEGTAEDIAAACKEVRDAMQCFRDALADCKNNKNIPASTVQGLEDQMDSYDKMLQSSCDGSNSATGLKMTALTLVSTFLALIL